MASLWDIDLVTGVASNQRNGSFGEQAVGLTRLGNGAFYGLGIGGTLYTIEPVTAAVTTVGALGIYPPEGGIDFDPTSGLLYGINSTTGSARGLYSIDPGTGAATDIGDVQLGDLSAVAFDAFGTLWILDTINDELLTVDPRNGQRPDFGQRQLRLRFDRRNGLSPRDRSALRR
jgi:hypothetical protein